MYYFAYGSNMNHQQMKNRCPTESYRNIVIHGAKDCGLPEEYIKSTLEK